MHFITLASFLLPTLTLGAPVESRQTDPCIPTSYTITNYEYTQNADTTSSRISFNFQSHFSNTSIITDPSSSGALCEAKSPDGGSIPLENLCSTGRNNLFFDIRGSEADGDLQIIHTWTCNGKTWMSSTHHEIWPLDCTTDTSGTKCTSIINDFQAENVRQICNTPTCP
ncbi:hypothetical protein CC78DRAFT_583634 [Lojkania enalia]|uniref:AA1-like domain-containing protein n=1 Tax=Lojkania enalia TaxID=147567 RepID=A0A9P4N0N1_9PLEO|nr:hypothetical protein CC78DRAFT_583634 [Didymosphaeria enalia]